MQNKKRMALAERATKSNDDKGGGARAQRHEWFSPEELEAARTAYLEEQQQEHPSPKVKYRYALALVKSKKRDDKVRGVALLEDLLQAEFEVKECLYWIALTTYGLGDHRASRAYCERLLRIEPTHSNALALHQCIKDVTASDQLMGMGLVGAVVVAGLALKLLLKR